ncbi:DUF2062 domain-containing protein [Martelella alba]|uniref:DUF2062 domain-containing protein n=1 Tax=Martelella alba TaxID=2590451 RepID=A0A506UJK9_9HYPH|nr:DUF2062 domain-containing protein [Martelella alba]TPW33443.1 DUF2062 domain-containing protein [Martelella alba]
MLFRRRSPASLWQKFRSAVWPEKGFSRSLVYLYHRTLRLKATPHAIALGIAAGAAVSWTPFIGFHFVLAFAIAFVLGGNLVAAALGTAFGNPLTFPFIWLTTWRIGSFVLNRSTGDRVEINLVKLVKRFELSDLWRPLLEPMAVGAIIPALITGFVLYFLTFQAVSAFQQRRSEKLAGRRKRLAMEMRKAENGNG